MAGVRNRVATGMDGWLVHTCITIPCPLLLQGAIDSIFEPAIGAFGECTLLSPSR
jgi:hypothetical protein